MIHSKKIVAKKTVMLFLAVFAVASVGVGTVLAQSSDAKAAFDRGIYVMRAGDYDKAIIEYSEAIRLAPSFSVYYYARADTYKNKKDYDKAIADYTKALELGVEYVYYYDRAVCYEEKGNYANAVTDYEAALKLEPNNSWIQSALAKAREKNAKNIQNEVKPILSKTMDNANESWNSGDKYKGQVYNGKLQGWGIYSRSSGSYYFGGFDNSQMNGYGMYLIGEGFLINNCHNCVVYVGNWSNSNKSGKGTCYNKSGELIYYGDYYSDKPVGTYPTTSNYSNYKFQILDMANGAKYVGETKDGKRNGWGAYVWKNDDVWYGNWKDGIRSGEGMYSLYNGDWYVQNCSGDDCKTISSKSNTIVSNSGSSSYNINVGGSGNNGCNDDSRITCPACFGMRRKGTCTICRGTGRRAGNLFCYSCNGTGVGICGICLGVGTVSKSDPRFCNENIYDGRYKNSGDFFNPSGNVGVSNGGGGKDLGGGGGSSSFKSGYLNGGGRTKCNACGGTGKCSSCGGARTVTSDVGGYTGKTHYTTRNCPICRGTGNCGVCLGRGEI